MNLFTILLSGLYGSMLFGFGVSKSYIDDFEDYPGNQDPQNRSPDWLLNADFLQDQVWCSQFCASDSNYLLSSIVKLGDVPYYVQSKATFAGLCHPQFTPTTIIKLQWDRDIPFPGLGVWLDGKIDEFLAKDDVFSPHFLASVLLFSDNTSEFWFSQDDIGLEAFIKKWNMTRIFTSRRSLSLPEGPYFLTCQGLKQAWRVYEDTLDAFQVGVVPTGDVSALFEPLPVSITSSTHLSIAVPSHLFSGPPTPEKSLSGLRIGVKDIIDLSGIPTSYQSRAYLALRKTPPTTSASVVQALIDNGAVVIGKTRTTQFAAGEQASGDWIDFLAPWNPRGDGWLVPGMSSAGSASAVAGYEWIDGAIGSDTLGSMTGPAVLQGLFGNRISTGRLKLDGVMPITGHLDTIGFFARDITTFNTVLKAWLPDLPAKTQDQHTLGFPKTLLYPTDYFPLTSFTVQAPIEAFVAKLETFLHIRRTSINFADEWRKTADFAGGAGIQDYLQTVVSTLQLKGSWDNSRGFAEEYKRVFGREMEVHSQVRHKWKMGAQLTQKQVQEAERKMREYKEWLGEQFFSDGCRSAVLVLPVFEVGKVMHRDEYRGAPEEENYVGMGWYEGLEPVLAGLPVVIVPVGQFPYDSRITGQEEWSPVGLAIVAARDCDLMLADLLESVLVEAGMGKVRTGRIAFDEDMFKIGGGGKMDEWVLMKDEL